MCKDTNFHLTAKCIAAKYLEEIRSDPDWKVQALVDAVRRDFCLDICLMKAYRAKSYALEKINGDERSQYDHMYRYVMSCALYAFPYKIYYLNVYECLFRYKAEILRTNPGSSVEGRWKDGVFVGMYMCFAALKSGFKKGCRPLVCLDGCWLKGTYGGQLLSAVGVDPNDCMYPIAYAVVEIESKETWTWFLEHLAMDLEIQQSSKWTFMSDRQKVSV